MTKITTWFIVLLPILSSCQKRPMQTSQEVIQYMDSLIPFYRDVCLEPREFLFLEKLEFLEQCCIAFDSTDYTQYLTLTREECIHEFHMDPGLYDLILEDVNYFNEHMPLEHRRLFFQQRDSLNKERGITIVPSRKH